MTISRKHRERVLLVSAFAIAAFMALMNLRVGGPQVNIDDFSLYEGGFLVWFGHAPPQHAYLECWINGLTSLFTFFVKNVLLSGETNAIGLEFVSHAYSDFYYRPDVYYASYRFVIVMFFLATAGLIYLIGLQCVRDRLAGLAPALAAIFYLFSFNAYWCNLAGRPDTLVAFFAVLGLYFYLRSDYRNDSPWFWLAAVAFGVAAGLKLHGAFFAIFAALDLLRVKGLRAGLRSALLFAVLSVALFMVSDGALLFDPLKYVKARMLTYQDDHSPWLIWGQQFWTILRGSGWLAGPLALVALFFLRGEVKQEKIRSVVFIGLCFLLLFASIRQLRAYWMLPALPLFYLSALVVLDRMKQLGYGVALIAVAVCMGQSIVEVKKIQASHYNELRSWVESTVTERDSVYLVGYTVLRVPRSQSANTLLKSLIEKSLVEDTPNFGFTYRHLKNWEELTTLRLLDMLISESGKGYNVIGYLERGVDFEKDESFLKAYNYIIVQDRFGLENCAGFERYLEQNFTLVTQLIGEGGEGYGLNYKIFIRN